jgi:hypothetical protein
MQKNPNHILICSRNDEEALTILQIAEKLKINILESAQPHGAQLGKEPNLLVRLQEDFPDARTLAIVEIPGPKMENELTELGYTVNIIDHHRYGELDRMKQESSLEQFLAYFEITDEDLTSAGFDPLMISAVGAIDRGFLWELDTLGITDAQKKEARAYYRGLTLELGAKMRLHQEGIAKEAWDRKTEQDGMLIIESADGETSIRDSLSYLIADTYGKPRTAVIKQGNRRIYVQESDFSQKLLDAFGGFTFGRDRCWGILKEDGSIPSIDEVIAVIRDN